MEATVCTLKILTQFLFYLLTENKKLQRNNILEKYFISLILTPSDNDLCFSTVREGIDSSRNRKFFYRSVIINKIVNQVRSIRKTQSSAIPLYSSVIYRIAACITRNFHFLFFKQDTI